MLGIIGTVFEKFFGFVYFIIIGFIREYFLKPVYRFVFERLYTDSAGREYNLFIMFLVFSILTTFALSALLYGGAFFMIGTIIFGWVTLFKKLKEFREKNK